MTTRPLLILALLFVSMSSFSQQAGTFQDPRDNKIYKTVKLGNQTWMAENLAYKAANGCRAYNNDESVAKVYGYLYTWETAKKVCPSGWHLPSKEEWMTLVSYLGGDSLAHNTLKEAGPAHWKDEDPYASGKSGFKALPAGIFSTSMMSDKVTFKYLGNYAYWWTSTAEAEQGSLNAWFRQLGDYYKNESMDTASMSRGSSVRCIKD